MNYYSSLGGINENLHRLFPHRSLDAIKSHLRGAKHKGYVQKYKEALLVGRSPHVNGVNFDSAPAIVKNDDPQLWEILAKKE